MKVTILQEFETAQTPSLPSDESRGLTVQQHENLHRNDLETLLSNEFVNAKFQSEGFSSFEGCECARDSFYEGFENYMEYAMDYSGWLRDVLHSVDPIQ